MSSMDVLLDRISTDNHYARWVGGEETLISLAKEVHARLQEQGISNRTPQSIRTKIQSMLQKMAITREMLDQKGLHDVVMLRDCKDEKLKGEVEEICPYFELLGHVVATASSFHPLDQKSEGQNVVIDSAPKQNKAQDGQHQASSVEAQAVDFRLAHVLSPTETTFEASLVSPTAEHGHQSFQELLESNWAISVPNANAGSDTMNSQSADARWPSGIQLPDIYTSRKSMRDVIVAWLAKENNYERWESTDSPQHRLWRNMLYDEINVQLHAQGIFDRTAADIWDCIVNLEQSMHQANELLVNKGIPRDMTPDKYPPALMTEILATCNHFMSLGPVILQLPKQCFQGIETSFQSSSNIGNAKDVIVSPSQRAVVSHGSFSQPSSDSTVFHEEPSTELETDRDCDATSRKQESISQHWQ